MTKSDLKSGIVDMLNSIIDAVKAGHVVAVVCVTVTSDHAHSSGWEGTRDYSDDMLAGAYTVCREIEDAIEKFEVA